MLLILGTALCKVAIVRHSQAEEDERKGWKELVQTLHVIQLPVVLKSSSA